MILKRFYDRPVYLLAGDAVDAAEAVRQLALIGLDNVPGWAGPDALTDLGPDAIERIPQVEPAEAYDRLLQRAGRTDVSNMSGGISRYDEEGLPVERTTEAFGVQSQEAAAGGRES